MSLLDFGYALTLYPHYLYHKYRTGKYGSDIVEKTGAIPDSVCNAAAASDEKVFWIHAVSVGETLAARPLVLALRERFPKCRVCVSTTTATGREVAQKNFGAENVFYFPLDFTWMVRRVFEKIKPSLVVLMELELWPQFLREAERRDVPVAVSNVRITDRSVEGFKKAGRIARNMFRRVSCWASQNEAYAEKLRSLGVRPECIHVVGSLKYDGLDFSENSEEENRLRAELGGGDFLVAGSTHEGEEEIVYSAFAALRNEFPKLKLCLVPRHPERCDEVEKKAPEGLLVWRRSKGTVPEDADIILGDLMGELFGLYRVSSVAFVGGTFLPKVGGHNMLEPAALGRPVLYGPEVHNFEEPAELLLRCGGAVMLPEASEETLCEAAAGLLRKPEFAAEMGRRAREAAMSMQGATKKTVELLTPLLKK